MSAREKLFGTLHVNGHRLWWCSGVNTPPHRMPPSKAFHRLLNAPSEFKWTMCDT